MIGYYQPGGPRPIMPPAASVSASVRLADPSAYLPPPDLVDAVNVALLLGQPLLLTGEPGCGKTQLGQPSRLVTGVG